MTRRKRWKDEEEKEQLLYTFLQQLSREKKQKSILVEKDRLKETDL